MSFANVTESNQYLTHLIAEMLEMPNLPNDLRESISTHVNRQMNNLQTLNPRYFRRIYPILLELAADTATTTVTDADTADRTEEDEEKEIGTSATSSNDKQGELSSSTETDEQSSDAMNLSDATEDDASASTDQSEATEQNELAIAEAAEEKEAVIAIAASSLEESARAEKEEEVAAGTEADTANLGGELLAQPIVNGRDHAASFSN